MVARVANDGSATANSDHTGRYRRIVHEQSLPIGVRLVRLLASVVAMIALVGCQTSEPVRHNPVVSDEGRALHRKLEAEAAALGTAQVVMSMPAAWDPTGMA